MAEYIEREAALREIERREALMVGDKRVSVAAMKSFIKNRQAADVAPVRNGQWIEYTKVIIPEPYNKWEQAWKCSECGFDDGFVAYNYCPNCGAKMDIKDGGDNDAAD